MDINQAKLDWIYSNNDVLTADFLKHLANEVWKTGKDNIGTPTKSFNQTFLLDIQKILNNDNFNNLSCRKLLKCIEAHQMRIK